MIKLLPSLFAHSALDETEREALAAVAGRPQVAREAQCIVRQGAATEALTILCSGVAMASRAVCDGKQQIVAIFVPGDVVDCAAFPLRHARAGVSALTSAAFVQIPYNLLEDVIARLPGIGRFLWRETAAQSALQQEWLACMGRRQAYQRVAHFLCELSWRFSAGHGDCKFPLTQSHLADAMGLSSVHINRVLQRLRAEGLIELSHGRLTIRDSDALYGVAGFEPQFLEFLRRSA